MQIFKQLKKRLELSDCVLVTLAQTDGSTPRSAGSYMIVWSDGEYGTIGGGLLEHTCILEAKAALGSKNSFSRSFILSKGDSGLDMACGGGVAVHFQYIRQNCPFMTAMIDKILSGEARQLILQKNGPRASVSDGSTAADTDACYVLPLPIRYRVHVFGCGHVAQALIPLLHSLDFECFAYDDRPGFVAADKFPTASEVSLVDYSTAFNNIRIGSHDCVIALTHGHRADADVLAAALDTPAMYIGAIGSMAKKAFVDSELARRGYDPQRIASIHTPIGVAIGADTPMEIAVSIAAQLIRVRSEKSGKLSRTR